MAETVTDSKTWARTLMTNVRALQDLHRAVPLYGLPGDEYSYDDKDEAIDEFIDRAYSPMEDTPDEKMPSREEAAEVLEVFLVCDECRRVERGAAAEIGYEASLWPCATSRAGGWSEAPVL